MLKRLVKVLVCLVLSIGFAPPTFAQTYPMKPIRVVVPWVAGGAVEALARVLENKMSPMLGQPMVIEARAGANGTIGSAAVAKAAPDGYTLLIAHVGPMAIAPALQSLPYDPIKDFEPVTQLVSGPTILVVRPDVPVHTTKELIEHAKANPGKLTYGSVGIGSTTHLAGEMMAMMTGIDIIHVPYKGAPPIVTDMLGGRVSMAFLAVTSGIQHVRSGALRAIAITSLQRSSILPDLATVSETLPGFELSSWHGFMLPAGTPKPIVTRLFEATKKALAEPDVIEWLKQNGLEAVGSTPENYAAYIRSEGEKWARIVKEANVKVN